MKKIILAKVNVTSNALDKKIRLLLPKKHKTLLKYLRMYSRLEKPFRKKNSTLNKFYFAMNDSGQQL
jgi:DNA-binding transcriptional regulator/RsmH inhibitor MraZ